MTRRTLVLLCMAAGIALGLGYAWLIDPVTFTESSPAQVVVTYRHAWLIMAAEAYARDGDWERTRARLDSLHDPDLPQTVVKLFDQASAQGPNPVARALARVADRLNVRTAAMLVYLATPVVTPTPAPALAPRPTDTPGPTATSEPVLPTLTPTVTPVPAYQLVSQAADCKSESITPQIEVTVQDPSGAGLPGKEVWITWDGGADRFVTGLKPEIDPGYGDFAMAIDQTYSVGIDKPTAILVSGLRADPCSDGRTSWRLVFQPIAP